VVFKSDLEHTLSQLVVDDDDDEDDDDAAERHAHSVPIVCSHLPSFVMASRFVVYSEYCIS